MISRNEAYTIATDELQYKKLANDIVNQIDSQIRFNANKGLYSLDWDFSSTSTKTMNEVLKTISDYKIDITSSDRIRISWGNLGD